MKRPRIEDIDATAVIDPSWDKMPRIEKPPKQAVRLPSPGISPNPASEVTTMAYAPYGRTSRRVMKRHPFEIYIDQLQELRRLAELDKRRGGNGSMSEWVRERFDQLIADKKEELDKSVRTPRTR